MYRLILLSSSIYRQKGIQSFPVRHDTVLRSHLWFSQGLELRNTLSTNASNIFSMMERKEIYRNSKDEVYRHRMFKSQSIVLGPHDMRHDANESVANSSFGETHNIVCFVCSFMSPWILKTIVVQITYHSLNHGPLNIGLMI